MDSLDQLVADVAARAEALAAAQAETQVALTAKTFAETQRDVAREAVAERDRTIVEQIGRIDGLEDENERLKAEIALLRPPAPAFVLGDATRKQFLGAPFTEQFPGLYENSFWPSNVTDAQQPTTPIQRSFVSGTAMPKWRASYQNARYWFGDLELFHSGGLTVAEVAKLLPAYQGARDFADNEGKGLQLGAYGIPPRFGTHMTDAEVMAQAEICRPILNLLDYCLLTLYPIYTDMEKSRTYIRRNIDLGRRAMPGKKVIVLGAPGWHPTVGAPLAGTPISVEWWRMFLEEVRANADGFAIWMKADQPKPTTEPWWLETQSFAL
jgi:hypothetical protein